jgi:hypothetical protein
MTLEEFIGKVSDARNARQGAMEKVKAALEELSAANSQMDQALAFFPEGTDESTIDKWDFTQMSRSMFDEMFAPAKAMSKLFNFGDLF